MIPEEIKKKKKAQKIVPSKENVNSKILKTV